ncbi:MAG: NAD-dependent epimerase/dehydratase family protein [Bryobacteraceae bacterium]
MTYRNKRVLVTGGLGFIGSNLALRLAREGARVTIVDPCVAGCGGNDFNIEPEREKIRVVPASIAERGAVAPVLAASDVVFNLAGEISHIHSMLFPDRDLEINTLAQLKFLETCVEVRPGVRVIYAGTRQVYGAPDYLPVDEKHPVNPVDFNGVHKYAATMYHLMLTRMGQLDAVVLRLTNVYGPRMALDVPCQGFLGAYIRQAVTGQRLEVYGDGLQLRDPLYVDDAVEAMLAAGALPAIQSHSYNVGGPEALALGTIASITSLRAGGPDPRYREFPAERKAIDIGSYYTDTALIREQTGWRPAVRFEDGIGRTFAYFREHLSRYLDPANPNPPCKLQHLRVQITPAGETVAEHRP